jgi:RNA polymerase sigma factor FliA
LSELKLWDAYQADRSIANRDALIGFYYDWLQIVARRYFATLVKWSGVEEGDLFNDAVPALIERIESFDVSRGVKFTTYAQLRILGAMADAMRSRDWVPRLERKRQRNNENHKVVRMLPIHCDGGVVTAEIDEKTRFQLPPAKREISPGEIDRFWNEVCRGLGKKDRLILMMYYRSRLTMEQIGSNLRISESRVSQRMATIVSLLKQRDELRFLKVE